MARSDKTHPLAKWREQNGRMPMKALAEKVGCNQSFISQLESGIRQPSLGLAVRLSHETGLPIEHFLRQREVSQ